MEQTLSFSEEQLASHPKQFNQEVRYRQRSPRAISFKVKIEASEPMSNNNSKVCFKVGTCKNSLEVVSWNNHFKATQQINLKAHFKEFKTITHS